MVNEKLNLSFTGTYTDSTAEMDQLKNYTGSMPPNYDYDLSTVHTYSDLEVAQTDLSVAANYQVDDNVSVGCGFSYLRYDDDEPYLDDGTGEAYITNVSVSYLF